MKSVLDQILDPDNTDPILLYSEDGNPMRFEQVAVIPFGEEFLYLIARPLDDPNFPEGAALVFLVNTDEDSDEVLELVENDEIVEIVFSVYNAMLHREDDDLFS